MTNEEFLKKYKGAPCFCGDFLTYEHERDGEKGLGCINCGSILWKSDAEIFEERNKRAKRRHTS